MYVTFSFFFSFHLLPIVHLSLYFNLFIVWKKYNFKFIVFYYGSGTMLYKFYFSLFILMYILFFKNILFLDLFALIYCEKLKNSVVTYDLTLKTNNSTRIAQLANLF